jgi:two-component system, LytTR family, response regulator
MKVIILDDEILCTNLLEHYISKYCKDLSIIGVYNDSELALEQIEKLKPDILFLDVEMPKLNGFTLLDKLTNKNIHIIFTTAYNQYAIKALKYSAIDYLLKPINYTELIETVNKLQHKVSAQQSKLVQAIYTNKQVTKIALSNHDCIVFTEINDIINCVSEGNYTTFFLRNGDNILTSKLLKDVEEILTPHGFMRVHQSHLINTSEIKKYEKADGGNLLLSNATNVPVSRLKKQDLLDLFAKL